MRPILVVLLLLPMSANAAQSLVPSPYPSTSSPSLARNPGANGAGPAGQANLPSPYPQATGAGAQGNPSSIGPGAGQQQQPSSFRETYGVDQK